METCGGILPQGRVDCGYLGIQRDECEGKGCCWDSSVRDVPWCFHGVRPTTDRVTYWRRSFRSGIYREEPESKCDVGPASQRLDCGYAGIPEDSCWNRRCCWDDSIRDVPWCFYDRDVKTELNCNVGPATRRQDCGYAGIPEYACRQRNCCWDNSIPDVPWCFLEADYATTQLPVAHLPTGQKSQQIFTLDGSSDAD